MGVKNSGKYLNKFSAEYKKVLVLMHSLGKVIGISASGFAIIRCTKPPRLKASVFNLYRKKVGFVADIIGPVKNAYVLVKSNSRPGQELFAGD